MNIQTKRSRIVLTLATVGLACVIGASAQQRSSGFIGAAKLKVIRMPAAGRKVADDLNPQPLPPCEKCGVTRKPGGDQANSRPGAPNNNGALNPQPLPPKVRMTRVPPQPGPLAPIIRNRQ